MRFFKDAALAALSVAVVLSFSEIVLRLAGAKYPASLYTSEKERGYALRPNAEGWYLDEGECYIKVNSDGMRDREHSLEPPPNTFRIAFIGSSESAALQVPLEQRFHAEIERKLKPALAVHGWKAEVLDFGGPGYGMAQEYLTLRNHVWKYHPRIVILLMSVYTVLKNTRRLSPDSEAGVPYYVLKDGQLVPDAATQSAPGPSRWRQAWKDKSSDWANRIDLLSLARTAQINLGRKIEKMAGTVRLRARRQAGNAPPPDYVRVWPYLPDLPQMQEPWAIAESFFDLMKKECDQQHAEFWIVTTDMNLQTHVDASKREAFRKKIGAATLFASEARIERFTVAHNIHTLLLAPILADYSASHHVPLHGFFNTEVNIGHWNELGHRVVGDAISEELLSHSEALRNLLAGSQPDVTHKASHARELQSSLSDLR